MELFYNLAYHAQSIPAERVNRVLKTAIVAYIKDDQRRWDENLDFVVNALNTARHEVTGYSPFKLMFGEEWCGDGTLKPALEDPVEVEFAARDEIALKWKDAERIRQNVRDRLKTAYERNCKYYNLRRRVEVFQVGQKVYRENRKLSKAGEYYSAKLAPKFVGPFTISKRIWAQGIYCRIKKVILKDHGI